MSESREKKRRYNEKLAYIAAFEIWLNCEPPIFLFWRWRKWRAQRPICPWNALGGMTE